MESEKSPIGLITFDSLKLLELSVKEPQQKVDAKDFDFSVSTEFKLSDNNSIIVLQTITSSYLGNVVLDATFEAKFGSIDFSSLLTGGKKIQTNDLFYKILAGLAFSTARGIIWSKVSSTNLSNMILPIIDPSILVGPYEEEQEEDAKVTKS